MGRWGDGEMGRWGDGEMGRWGRFPLAYSLFPLAYSLFPIPYSLFPIFRRNFIHGSELVAHIINGFIELGDFTF